MVNMIKKLIIHSVAIPILIIFQIAGIYAQQIPVVQILNNPSPGYFYFDIIDQYSFQLFDNYGELINKKETISKKRKKILENGKVSEFDINRYLIYNEKIELIDSIKNPTNYTIDFHDFVALRNGRYLMLLNRKVTMDLSNIVEGGQKDAVIIDNVLIETDGRGNIFWTWNAIDHLVITDATSAVDLTMNVIDFAHINSMFEDPDGNILISIRNYDEIALINKQTKEFIWRFGGQASKKNQFTILNDEIGGFKGFSHQHTASILPNGNILLFDNGNLKPNPYSRAVEYSLNIQNKTATKVWEYRHTPDIYIFAMGSAYRLENGNTLIGWSKYGFSEVRPDKTIVFEAVSTNPNGIYRVQKTNIGQTYASLPIYNLATYDFNSINNITGIKIKVDSISGNGGKTHLQKHFYSPHRGTYQDSNFLSILPYRWVFSNDGGFNYVSGEFILDPSTIPQINFPQCIVVYKREGEDKGSFQKLQTIYDSLNNRIIAKFKLFGEFTIAKTKLSGPSLLSPQNGSKAIPVYSKLIWKEFLNAKKYHLQLAVDTLFQKLIKDTIVVNSTELIYQGLKYDNSYFWRLRAIAGEDTTEWSDTFAFRTKIEPPQITNPKFNSIGFRNNDYFVWDSIPYVDSYHLQVSTEKTFQTLVIDSTGLKLPHFKASGLGYNTTYYCRVRSIRTPDTSEWSNSIQFTTVLASPIPIYPSNKAADIPNSVQFRWHKVNGAEIYNLEISDDQNFLSIKTVNRLTSDTTTLVTDLNSELQYYWRVKSIRSTDTSDWSDIYAFTTQSNDTSKIELNSPIILYPNQNEFAISIKGKIRWSKVDSAKTYQIELINLSSSPNTEFTEAGIKTTEFIYDSLDYDTKYKVQVLAARGISKSQWSNPIFFTTELNKPVIIEPTNLSVNVPEKGKIHFDLDGKTFNFHIQISTDSAFNDIIIDQKGITDYFYEYTLLTEQKYYCRVMHYNDSNRSQWSEIVKFTTGRNNSVFENNSNNLRIYQNPKTKQIIIESDGYLDIRRIIIYDLLGNKLSEEVNTKGNLFINTNDLMNGMYIIIIEFTGKNNKIHYQSKYVSLCY